MIEAGRFVSLLRIEIAIKQHYFAHLCFVLDIKCDNVICNSEISSF